MSRQQLLSVGIIIVLVMLFLVGCEASASTALSKAEPATSAPEPVVVTPTLAPATPTPEPPAATPTPEPALDPLIVGDPERGQTIFENGGEKYIDKPQYRCIRCHALDGSEGYGPSLQGISEQAGDRVPELSAVEYLRQSIVEPDAYVIEGFSHSMGRIHSVLLSEEEIDDLIAFMLTQ